MNRFKKDVNLSQLKDDIKLNISVIVSLFVIITIGLSYYKWVENHWQILLLSSILIGCNTLLLFKLFADVLQYWITKNDYLK